MFGESRNLDYYYNNYEVSIIMKAKTQTVKR